MIVTTLCNSCLQSFELQVSSEETYLLREIMGEDSTIDCPRLCGGKILFSSTKGLANMANDPRLRDPVRLTGKELYKAVKGVGLPDEVPSSKEVVEALLVANQVIGAEIEVVGKRIFLHELRLKNRTILHLSSGKHGCEVVKITRF